MGRHFEVRAKSMAATAAKKSALYMRASKEVYMAARAGVPDPNNNLALRAAVDKWKGQSVPKDVLDRAIKKAAGGDAVNYIEGRYEAFGPGGSYIVVDTLSDNINRALSEVRTIITKKGGHLGSVLYNFFEAGVFSFKGNNKDEVEETLILDDVDVTEVSESEGMIHVLVAPTDFQKAKTVLEGLGISEFETCEITLLANEEIEISDPEELKKFNELIDGLDELQDVQAVHHNVSL
ncbi:MAG: YebC/PmpR family DNA-binding transcriptional regulator [Erysipelotrichaceae bacterium]|jgi:YebC/PmpR family DNA-binding regulatory protein|nr:YebC/PmpR family DNA-binding transcriptional regulator [Erysipelotrichaceae bacterium]